MRAGAAIAVAVVAVLGSACVPPTGEIPLEGGTFDVDVTIPSQEFSYEFLFCDATASTDPIDLTGATIEVPSVSINPSQSVVTVPDVVVTIPSGTAAAGSINVSCFGTSLGNVGISLTIAGTATTETAVLNTATGELSLSGTSILLDGATVEIPGVGSVPLPPFEVDLGSINVDI